MTEFEPHLDDTNASCDYCDGEAECVHLQAASPFADDVYICQMCALKVLGLALTELRMIRP